MIKTHIKPNILFKELRIRIYTDQSHMEYMTGLSKSYISKVERGEIPITDNTFEKYAKAMGITIDEFNHKILAIESSMLTCDAYITSGTIDETQQIAQKAVDSKKCKCNEELQLFKDRQQRIFKNKENHGFNVTNIYQEARYILEEVAELMRAIEKNDRPNMKEELADIIIFTYGCAEVARLGNLDEEIFKKMAINENRVYKQTESGDFVKTNK